MKGNTAISPKNSQSSRFGLANPAIRIAPSLLAADFSRLKEELAVVESAGVEVLHLDVMDGHFVPNISFGAPVISSLRKCTKMFFDAHLMITEPKRYAESFAKAGCDLITFHIEVTDEPLALVEHIRNLGVSVGVSLNPTTPVSTIQSIIDAVDLVLVMSVWPGFGGQKFIEDVLEKIEEIKGRLGPHQRLEIDGGIDVATIGLAAKAGADTFVAGTAIFRQADPVKAMHELERLAISQNG
ncbi:MAG: ribulose-phosphate 3-epimerase [Planctomycetes bacterium]|nr:ribulose-phosphate 3-epimerase [Planctomycetota bacterium]